MKHTRCNPGAALAAATLLLATLGGCRALPALHYYALEAASPVSAPIATSGALLIHVRHVGLPREMDHLGLTHHIGPTELVISDQDQWTAPLNVLIQSTLTRDLGARLGFEHVVATDALPVVRGRIPSTLDFDFVTLVADASCGITAQVNWTWSVPNGAARAGSVQLAVPASGCPAGLPAALSTALGELADQLLAPLSAP